jgi:hypothetical protein
VHARVAQQGVGDELSPAKLSDCELQRPPFGQRTDRKGHSRMMLVRKRFFSIRCVTV